MAIIVETPESVEFEICPEGTIQAVVSNVYDIGKQIKKTMNGEEVQNQVIVLFELAERMVSGNYSGERFVLSKTYKKSFHEMSALHKDIEAILGKKILEKSFDIETLIGTNCYLSIIHQKRNEKTYVNIQSIIKIPVGIKLIEPELQLGYTPDWIKKKIDNQIKESISLQHYSDIENSVQIIQNWIDGGFLTNGDIKYFLNLYGASKINDLNPDQLSQMMNDLKKKLGVN